MIPLIHPQNQLYRAFHFIINLLIVYSAIEVPLRLVLPYEVPMWLHILDLVVIGFFATDIVLQFHVQTYHRGKLCNDRKILASKYLRGWFPVDLLATLPFELLATGAFSEGHRALRMVRLMRLSRLLKLARLHRLSRDWHTNRVLNQSLVRLIFFGFWIVLISHWLACGWIFLEGVPKDEPFPAQYLDAIYWTVTTLTTVGYGDITPISATQKIYTMFVMFFGVAVYGYVIGNISTLLASTDLAKTNYVNKIEELNTFFEDKTIPFELQEKIRDYYNHIWQSRLGRDEAIILNDLPESLRTEVTLYLNREIIHKVPMFHDAGEEFIRELAAKLEPAVFLPGDLIIHKGEIGDRMYFVSRGHAELLGEDGQAIATFAAGSYFGEMALVLDQPRAASIRAIDYCDVYILRKQSFVRLLEKYNNFHEHLRDVIARRKAELG